MSVPAAIGNGVDSVRRHNLAAVLRIVHRRGPQSRSVLTRETGLNRSTVGLLVGELVGLGLVSEGAPEPGSGVGRPSPVVAANGRVLAASVNPEVDAVHVGLVGLDGNVHAHVSIPTGHVPSPREAAEITASALEDLCAATAGAGAPLAIGVAVPGLVRMSDGVVRMAPHLKWVDEPFQSYLEGATGLPVRVANDASIGAHAELVFGAGRGISDLVYLHGGASGIGGGLVSRGTLLTGASGYAGEIGHTLVNSAGARCQCGATGCLETEARRDDLIAALGRDAVADEDLGELLAGSRDPGVAQVVCRQLGFLAIALRGAINSFNPQRVVLGGFLASLDAAAPGMLAELARQPGLKPPVEAVEIVPASLGANLLLVGAAELAFQQLLADPASVLPRSDRAAPYSARSSRPITSANASTSASVVSHEHIQRTSPRVASQS